VFAQTTHVVAAPHGFACVAIPATRLYIPSFIEIRSGVSEPQGVKIWPFTLLWLVAFTTACTTVQAVILATSVNLTVLKIEITEISGILKPVAKAILVYSNSKKQMTHGKIGRFASEEVLLQLVNSKCIPALLRGLEACHLNKTDLRSLDFLFNRFLIRLFKTNDLQTMECQSYFGFQSERSRDLMLNMAL